MFSCLGFVLLILWIINDEEDADAETCEVFSILDMIKNQLNNKDYERCNHYPQITHRNIVINLKIITNKSLTKILSTNHSQKYCNQSENNYQQISYQNIIKYWYCQKLFIMMNLAAVVIVACFQKFFLWGSILNI